MFDIRDFSFDELKEVFGEQGHPEFRVKQLFKWIYDKYAGNFDDMTNLSKDFRRELADEYGFRPFPLIDRQVSSDGTQKFLFQTFDGQLIESVLIPDEDRHTACVSSQAGCAMACGFCNTGDRGFERNLDTWEIICQLLGIIKSTGIKPNNIVFMGMGEPLANYDNVVRAIRIMYNPDGFKYSPRKVTLSTCGLADKIDQLGRDIDVKLAVSLNATTDDVRNRIMPVNKKFPIARLLESLRAFPLGKDRDVTIEYVLINGENDTIDDAKRLYEMLKGIRVKINLIAYNPWGKEGMERPDPDRVFRFQKYLWDKKMRVIQRSSKGQDILAACGQLRGLYDAGSKSKP